MTLTPFFQPYHIVAVVVTAIIAPYAIAAVTNLGAGASLGTAFSTAAGVFSAGGTGLTAAVAGGASLTAAGAAVVGAIVGFAGGVSSQTFAVATGIQSKFDWEGVAMGAISGGVGGGVAKLLPAVSSLTKALTTSIVSQGVNVAVGLQKKFDWTGLAVAGIAGGVANQLGGWAESRFGKIGGGALTGTASLLAGAATHSLLTGQSFGRSLKEALPGAIGTTIGNMIGGRIVAAMQGRRTSVDEVEGSVSVDNMIGSDGIDSFRRYPAAGTRYTLDDGTVVERNSNSQVTVTWADGESTGISYEDGSFGVKVEGRDVYPADPVTGDYLGIDPVSGQLRIINGTSDIKPISIPLPVIAKIPTQYILRPDRMPEIVLTFQSRLLWMTAALRLIA
jgi:hypothetical protein